MKNKTLLVALLLIVPMSAYAGIFPDPFEASNTAKDAYNWIQQAIPEMAQTKTEASNAILDEQVLQMNVNTDFADAKAYTQQAVNGILGEANSNAAVSIKAADREQDMELVKQTASTLAQAQKDANGALSSALSSSAKGDATTLNTANVNAQGYAQQAQNNSEAYASTTAQTDANKAQSNAEAQSQSDVNTLAKSDAQSFTTKHLQVNGNESVTGSSTVGGNETVDGTLTANGANMDNNVIQNVAAGTTGTDAANVNQVQQGDTSTLNQANSYTNTQVAQGDKATLKSANNYTNEVGNAVNQAAQGYASTAQSNSEQFAQGAANQAQDNANQYAAAGIAAALAMPSSPYLRPGHYAVGIQAATYGGEQGFGARATYQINNHWSANAGLSGGSGEYGQVGATVGVQFEG